jgi:hypothetical protein
MQVPVNRLFFCNKQLFNLKFRQISSYILYFINGCETNSFLILKDFSNIFTPKNVPDAAQIFSLFPSYAIILEAGVNSYQAVSDQVLRSNNQKP